MAYKTLKTLAAALALAFTGVASAGTSPFTMVSGANDPGLDLSLTVQQSGLAGYAYDFIVHNNSAKGTVTGVYFEQDWTSKLSGAGTSTGPAVLNPGSANPAIAGWQGPMASHTVGTVRIRKPFGRGYKDYYYDNLAHGIAAGQSQTFSFVTDTSIVSLGDLQDMLGNPGFGVAVRVQDLLSDRYAAGWGLVEPMSEIEKGQEGQDENDQDITGVPTPTAAFAGLAIMGIAGLRRRRK